MDARPADDEPDSKEMNEILLRLMRGVNGQAFRLFGNKVMGGPFTGMAIPAQAPWADGNSGVKLMGVYEHELHEAIAYAVWRDPRLVVNVGCAEGYYAIGFAKGAKTFALDIDADARFMCEDYAERNHVQSNLSIFDGAHEPEKLRFDGVPGHRLYFLDCEGAENELIDLERCPELRSADIIVECHDFMRPGTSRILADRLAATHRVELVRPRLPDFGQFQFMRYFPTAMSVLMVVEKRPMPCYWLTCWANSRGVGNG